MYRNNILNEKNIEIRFHYFDGRLKYRMYTVLPLAPTCSHI